MILANVSRVLRTAARTNLVPRARVSSMPAEQPLAAWEHIVGFMSFFVVIMAPSSWVLCHLEEYKKR